VKVILLRADQTRHKALAHLLNSKGYLIAQVIEQQSEKLSPNSSLVMEHFKAREQFEKDFFSDKILHNFVNVPDITVGKNLINSKDTIKFIKQIDFDIAITFGVSILNSKTINALHDKILGIHLGLSPYYRGSGTNFFPFVNNELEAVGYTLMHLDSGVDTGNIVHQGRAPIVLGDSIHTIGNRNIRLLFGDIIKLIESKFDFSISKSQISRDSNRYYRKKDFSEQSLRAALENLNNGLVERYLSDASNMNSRYPIFISSLVR
jgi:methionyl-tRNA formyltransferase